MKVYPAKLTLALTLKFLILFFSMSVEGKRFATHVGCMDGRVVEPILKFTKDKFDTDYTDNITEAGIVRLIAHNPDPKFLDQLKYKLEISLKNHSSVVVVVEGHESCAGNPVDKATQEADIRRSVEVLQTMLHSSIPIIGVYVREREGNWVVEEVSETKFA